MKYAKRRCAAGLLLPLAAVLPAAAAAAADTSTPTNVPGIASFNSVPPMFNRITASPEMLAAYGFPPRPDEATRPAAYAQWLRATSPAIRRIAPILKLTNIHHLTLRDPGRSKITNDATSSNWSGYVADWGGSAFSATQVDAIQGYWAVPSANVAAGTCKTTTSANQPAVFSSAWVGIDGATSASSDLLQSGTESDAQCLKGGKLAVNYDAWIEWVPNAETVITNFPVGPGDGMYVEVSASSATAGLCYVADYHTDVAVSVKMTPPGSTKLIGDSAEWVVERPEINGALATLANYGLVFMDGAEAVTGKEVIIQPAASYTPGTVSSTPTDMLDNNGKVISIPSAVGPSAVLWQVTGSAE